MPIAHITAIGLFDWDAGYFCNELRCILVYDADKILKPFCTLFNEAFILPAVLQDDMHQSINQGDIRAGSMTEMKGGEIYEIDLSRIGNHQFRAAIVDGMADHTSENRMLLGRI
jgi:hypothetical protein